MHKSLPIPPKVFALIAGFALVAAACVNPVQAAGSPTPWPIQTPTGTAAPWGGTAAPTATIPASSTTVPLPRPICTIEWAWRDAGLTITAVDVSRSDGLAPGDLILAIDGRAAEVVIAEIESGLGNVGDPALRRALALDALLYGNEILVLRVRHGQQPAYFYILRPDCRV
ncbi:MAG TPA: hypothetical protein VMN57_15260 [Anaerolineales bacterium]|nr:hypothetical protein [Anaerolineales bacterium]